MTLFLLFFFACSQHEPQQWQHVSVPTCYPRCEFSKTYFPICNDFSGLETEILTACGRSSLYFNVNTLQIPSDQNHSGYVTVSLIIDDQTFTFISELMQGGQRVKLADAGKDLIIDTLVSGRPVTVTIGRYKTVLTPCGF